MATPFLRDARDCGPDRLIADLDPIELTYLRGRLSLAPRVNGDVDLVRREWVGPFVSLGGSAVVLAILLIAPRPQNVMGYAILAFMGILGGAAMLSAIVWWRRRRYLRPLRILAGGDVEVSGVGSVIPRRDLVEVEAVRGIVGYIEGGYQERVTQVRLVFRLGDESLRLILSEQSGKAHADDHMAKQLADRLGLSLMQATSNAPIDRHGGVESGAA